MAVMNAAERLRVAVQYMREAICPGEITKADLQAAIAAADDWVDTNASTFNLALPLAFRTNATPAQKAALLCFVASRRVGRLNTAEG